MRPIDLYSGCTVIVRSSRFKTEVKAVIKRNTMDTTTVKNRKGNTIVVDMDKLTIDK